MNIAEQARNEARKIAQPEPTIRIMEVTPELALEWLLSMPMSNRVYPERLAYWVQRTASNQPPTVDAEPIRLDYNGLLNDGWHRCFSVLAANRPAKFRVSAWWNE